MGEYMVVLSRCQLAKKKCPLAIWCLANGELHKEYFKISRCPACEMFRIQVIFDMDQHLLDPQAFLPVIAIPPCIKRIQDSRMNVEWIYCSQECRDRIDALMKASLAVERSASHGPLT
jgi:hypothetical protein